MKTQCSEQKPKFEKVGQYIHIYIDEEIDSVVNEEGYESLIYKYHYTKVPIMISRSELIDSIIKINYPSFDAEIAAMANGGVDSEEHQSWRMNAKQIATEFEMFRQAYL